MDAPIPRNLGIALVTGLILLGLSFLVAWNPYTGSRGFPLSVTYVIPGCFGPGSPLGCLAYDPLEVVLDYVIWVGLSFVTIIFVDWLPLAMLRELKKAEVANHNDWEDY